MRLEIPFEAAEILNATSLKTDYPEVWKRYLNKREMRFGHRLGARVYTPLGRLDLAVIRDYFCLWLHEQELIPDDLRKRSDESLMRDARYAIGVLTQVIEAHTCSPAKPKSERTTPAECPVCV